MSHIGSVLKKNRWLHVKPEIPIGAPRVHMDLLGSVLLKSPRIAEDMWHECRKVITHTVNLKVNLGSCTVVIDGKLCADDA